MYCIEDRFFDDIQDVAEYLEWEFLIEQSDDYTIEVELCELETIGFLDSSVISERCFDDDRFPEDPYQTHFKIIKALESVNWDEINEKLPKIWYPNGNTIKLSKQELIDSIKAYNE